MSRNGYGRFLAMCPFRAVIGRKLCKRCQRLAAHPINVLGAIARVQEAAQ